MSLLDPIKVYSFGSATEEMANLLDAPARKNCQE